MLRSNSSVDSVDRHFTVCEDRHKWATLLFFLLSNRHLDRQNTVSQTSGQTEHRVSDQKCEAKKSSVPEPLLLRFSACQLSFADAPVVIPSQFICLDKKQPKFKVTDQDPFSVLDRAKLS